MELRSEDAMPVLKEKVKNRVGQWFALCPARHILLFAGAVLTALYYFLRQNRAVMQFLKDNIVVPYHRAAGKVFSIVKFSVAEWLYALVIVATMVYIIYKTVIIVSRDGKMKQVYITIVSLASCAIAIYAGICILWGICYYSDGFSEKSGLRAEPVEASKLAATTLYFAGLANEYADRVSRDADGLFNEAEAEYFDRGAGLYENAVRTFPFLDGPNLRPKPMVFSKIFSYMNFTGFFFAPTGEANLNTDVPSCMVPSTIAHEIAHQRGIAREDEANFVGIFAAVESGDERYIYSASLAAFTYLGNALHGADYESWAEIYTSLSEPVRADLRSVGEYWAKFETKVGDATEAVYSGFLESQGQELGIKSYGACVDLLVAYYGSK